MLDKATLTSATVTTPIDIRFAETDAMGVVHHAAYVVWLEMGRVGWLKAANVPYTDVVAAGFHFAVTGIQVNYRASSRFGDAIRMTTRVQKLRTRQIIFAYELHLADTKTGTETLLATATSEHICVDLTGKMAQLSSHLFDRLQAGIRQLASVK